MTLCARRNSRARVTIAVRRGQWCSHGASELPCSEQPWQPGVDAVKVILGVGGGVAGGAAEGRRGGEGTLGVLGRGEVVAVVGDDELEAELVGRGGGQRGAPPQLAHLTAERREIGLRPLARARGRRSAFDTPPPTRSSVSSSPAQSSGQSGSMQIHRQPSASAWLRLGSMGVPQMLQVKAKGSGMGTSPERG